jgi:hypothetical protein
LSETSVRVHLWHVELDERGVDGVEGVWKPFCLQPRQKLEISNSVVNVNHNIAQFQSFIFRIYWGKQKKTLTRIFC